MLTDAKPKIITALGNVVWSKSDLGANSWKGPCYLWLEAATWIFRQENDIKGFGTFEQEGSMGSSICRRANPYPHSHQTNQLCMSVTNLKDILGIHKTEPFQTLWCAVSEWGNWSHWFSMSSPKPGHELEETLHYLTHSGATQCVYK